MLGAGPAHALAPELSLRPVLTEIGASVPVRALYLLDSSYDDPAAYALAGGGPAAHRPTARRPDRSDRMTVGPLTTNQDLDPARLREAFGVFPSGVVAVAAEVDGELIGLAASSFTSVSLDPPLVSFSVANTSKTWPDLRRAEHLGVTVLADHHGEVCRQLAGPVAAPVRRLTVSTTETGRSPWTTGWPGSTARSTARWRPATTRWCCSGCTPSSMRTPRCRWCSTAAASAGSRHRPDRCMLLAVVDTGEVKAEARRTHGWRRPAFRTDRDRVAGDRGTGRDLCRGPVEHDVRSASGSGSPDSRPELLVYEVPEGQDPATIVTALRNDGLDATEVLRHGPPAGGDRLPGGAGGPAPAGPRADRQRGGPQPRG